MSVRVTQTFVCDVCDTELEEKPEPVLIGFLGHVYALDLCADCDDSINKTVGGFVSKVKSVGRFPSKPGPIPAQRTKAKAKLTPSAQVRAWATAEGIDVSANGRIPQSVMEKFKASQNGHSSNGNGSRRKVAA